MVLDTLILVTALASAILFIALHLLVVRIVGTRQVFPWIVGVFSFVGATVPSGSVVVAMQIPSVVGQYPVVLMAGTAFLAFILYALIVFIYVIGVFGIMVASVRMRILTDIYRAGTRGVRTSVFHRAYNRDVIIRTRLERLVQSGDIAYDDGYYRVQKRYAFVLVPAFLLKTLWVLYRGDDMYTSRRLRNRHHVRE